MRFEDEQYVRLYKRDTTTWKMLPWQAKCVIPLILRKMDRAGILDLGDDGLDALAVHLEIPIEVVQAAMPELLKRKVLVLREDGLLVWPRFIEAQEAKQSDKARQKAARDRARDVAAAESKGLADAPTPPSNRPDSAPSTTPPARDATVTHRDDPSRTVTPPSHDVTSGHTTSQGVTLSCAVNSSEVTSNDDLRVTIRGPLVEIGGPRCERCCEVFVDSLSEAGCRRPPIRDKWDRQAICDAVSTHLDVDGTIASALAALGEAASAWAEAMREAPQYTSGWSPRKFLAWLPSRDAVVAPARPSETRRAKLPPLPPDPEPEPMTDEERAEYAKLLERGGRSQLLLDVLEDDRNHVVPEIPRIAGIDVPSGRGAA